jgi:hypothetical protein
VFLIEIQMINTVKKYFSGYEIGHAYKKNAACGRDGYAQKILCR